MGAIPNWKPVRIARHSERQYFFEHHASLHSHYECVAISNGFHECWLQAWEPLWKGASPCPGLLEGFHTFRLNPETDTPPKTIRFHTKSHSKSEDFPFCDQMPLGVRFKRHCARKCFHCPTKSFKRHCTRFSHICQGLGRQGLL